jgi:serine/threonine-protein phosphatase 2B regulatory subunit
VLRLFSRFQNIDKDGNGVISKRKFMLIPELAINPLCDRIVTIIDVNKSDTINFRNFLETLNIFHEKATKDEKLQRILFFKKKVLFKIYDVDTDGYISYGDLFAILKMIVGENLKPEELKEIVQEMIIEADEDKDEKISFEEFKKYKKFDNDMAEQITIKF